MSPSLSVAEQDLLSRVAAIAMQQGPANAAHAAGDVYCWEALRALAPLGVLGLRVPQAQGGLGGSFALQVAIARALAQVDFGLALAVMNTLTLAHMLALEADPQVTQQHLPYLLSGEEVACIALTEPGAGSDAAALRTRAEKTPEGWVLNGEKAWVINAAVARVIVVLAQTEPGSGARGIASFVVDTQRAGFVRQAAAEFAVPNSFGLGGFGLENYTLSSHHLLQPPGQAFKSALEAINGARTYVAAMACGMVQECLSVARAYGEQRHTFGKALSSHQGWRWPIAHAPTDLAAASLLVGAAVERISAGQNAALQAAQAKLFATRIAEQHIAQLAQCMGAEGLREQHPFGRHQFAARAANLVDGSTEMLLERVFAATAEATAR